MSKRNKNILFIRDYNEEPNKTSTYIFSRVYRKGNMKSNTRYENLENSK